MAVTRECGKCNTPMPIVEKTADNFDIPHDCPHCGEKTPKRDGGPREKKIMTGHVKFEEKRKEFVTVDVSNGGLKVFYLGRPIPSNSEVTVDLEGMTMYGRKAMVAWSHKAASTYSHSGLKFI
ncbi:MAG: PilZ domain-containing protein [Nitrospinae bacterium]|nr:PilZ domain-containing protein [Nitrospinota bacterium]